MVGIAAQAFAPRTQAGAENMKLRKVDGQDSGGLLPTLAKSAKGEVQEGANLAKLDHVWREPHDTGSRIFNGYWDVPLAKPMQRLSRGRDSEVKGAGLTVHDSRLATRPLDKPCRATRSQGLHKNTSSRTM